ncbi:MAG: insulinase family protein [Candidatus Sumerlaeaceae bacterium]|nr:insulinase family protein [Candidatus Sumerlaeaceae bacterium]
MSHRVKAVYLFLLAMLCISQTFAQNWRIGERVREWKLDNGFTVLFLPREGKPFFSAVTYVDVGAVDEPIGRSGMAHLLEHMAFKGTPWVGTRNWNAERAKLVEVEETVQQLRLRDALGRATTDAAHLRKRLAELIAEAQQFVVPNEYDQLVTLAGGQQVNATTSADYTNYYMTLPSNQLELWAMLESQRLAYPVWREFYKERDVVAEERRMRMEDDPEGRLYEEFIASAFKGHPYGVPVIGWMSDILSLTATDINLFYRQWYVPQNMVAVVVGSVREDELRQVIERYFGSLEGREMPPRLATEEPEQRGERRVRLVVEAQPQLVMGWHKPPLPADDAVVFEVLQYVLTDNGRSSRLYTALVKQRGLCESVSSFTAPGEKYPNLFCIWATPRSPHSPEEVEEAVWKVLETIKHDGVTTDELQMSIAKAETSLARELDNDLGCAKQLGHYYLITRDCSYIDKFLAAMRHVDVADIQRVVRNYLDRDKVTVATIKKGKTESLSPAENVSARPKKSSSKPQSIGKGH